jgi:hypothetical protein
MPNLEFERQQLIAANRHIAIAEKNIEQLRSELGEARDAGDDTELAEKTLSVAENGLSAFQEHRELIVKIIDDVIAGRLPST